MLKFKTIFSPGEDRAVRRLSDLERLRIYRQSQTEQVCVFFLLNFDLLGFGIFHSLWKIAPSLKMSHLFLKSISSNRDELHLATITKFFLKKKQKNKHILNHALFLS